MKTILTILFILTASTVVFAEPWVCFDATTKHITRTVRGDGTSLGICDINNTNIIPTCIYATPEEYKLAKQAYKKYSPSVVKGIRIVDWTAQEISAYETAKANAVKQAKIEAVNNLEITTIDLGKALVQLGIVSGADLKNKIKEIKGLN